MRIDWEVGSGLAVAAVLSLEKVGRLKSSKAHVIPDGSEKSKKTNFANFASPDHC